MQKKYVMTRWGQVHVRQAGGAGPAVVLLHESPLSSAAYARALPFLARELRSFALDTPGYGESDGPPGVVEIPDYAATLLEAIDALGLTSFAVVGVHTGASLAVQLAVQARERVSAAVLSGVPVLDPQTRARYLESWAPPMVPCDDGSHFRWAWERYERIWHGPADLLHFGATTLLGNLENYHVGYQAAFRYDPEPDLHRVNCPVLLYTAEDDLLIASDELAVDRFSNARLEKVSGYAGQLPLRIPQEFADRVIRFVKEWQ